MDFWELEINRTTIYELNRDSEANLVIIDLTKGRERNLTSRTDTENGQEELDGLSEDESETE